MERANKVNASLLDQKNSKIELQNMWLQNQNELITKTVKRMRKNIRLLSKLILLPLNYKFQQLD